MQEILKHLLGSCGENHISILTIFSSGIVFLYKDYIVTMLKEIRDAMFK